MNRRTFAVHAAMESVFLGLLDLVQIAAKGLAPQTSYQVFLAESNQSPFGKLEPLAVVKTNPDGAGIVQAIGPLKVLAGNDPNSSASQRFLIVTDIKHVRAADLRPSAISNKAVTTLAETQGRIVKYYESMRLVYEIETRVRALRNASEEQPAQPQPKEPEKRNQNEKTSGHPENKRDNDRYVWELLNNTLAVVDSPALSLGSTEEAK